MRFEGKVAVVTGAAQGIGEAYARALAAEGAHVVVADVDERAQGVADDIKGLFVRTDVSDPASVEAMATAAKERFGGIDHLVNNAAIFGTMKLDFLFTVDWDYYKKFMSVNMDGALLCARACHPHAGSRRRFHREPVVHGGVAVLRLLRAGEGRRQRAHAAARARVGQHEHPRERDRARPDRHRGQPQRRARQHVAEDRPGQDGAEAHGLPEDLVGACLFLLSDDAAWITGQIINVDGGEVFRA